MHATSLENMRRCVERHLADDPIDASAPSEGSEPQRVLEVLDVGGADVNGSYRQLFPAPRYGYRVADISDAPSVDVHLADPYRLPLPDASVDLVVSGQMLEHCEFFWLTFAEMVRVLKPDGAIFLIAPSAGPVHRYPVDCYRFHPDAFAALAKHARCELVDVWRDERGPWCDVVGVFRRAGSRKREPAPPRAAAIAPAATFDRFPPSAPEEAIRGSVNYRDVLKLLHAVVAPRSYLEIGVRDGKSLALASCRAIGVDPSPAATVRSDAQRRILEMTSDRFFESEAKAQLAAPPDLAFIDGMHLFDFALRDFMNVERWSSPWTLAVLDDVFPNHPLQARRERTTRVWTGDVWKLHDCLRRRRPDLLLIPVDCAPTGLLLVAGLDRTNRVLWEQYNPIVREWDELDPTPPESVLQRRGALAPDDRGLRAALAALAQSARTPATAADIVARLRQAMRDAGA